MGALSVLLAYKIGKRKGRKKTLRAVNQHGAVVDERIPTCIHYESFCKNYGSCDELTCE